MMNEALNSGQLVLVLALALGLVLACGAPMIGALARLGAGQRVRDDGPQRHLQKEGTPTMGGVLIVGASVVAALAGELWSTHKLSLALLSLLAVMLAFGAIGAADDWMKISRGRSLGLKARQKLLFQAIASIAFVYALSGGQSLLIAGGATGLKQTTLWWAVFWVVAMTATSNAVNLSDGLDGLASGLCVIASLGFAALALKLGNSAVAICSLALAGACLGFLYFNRHPARIFMGDVGSLALGGVLAAMAAWLNQPLALIGLCLVPFIEAGSVVIQVISFKTTGKRVFKMSPIHHHFELSGWPETRVVLVFWLLALAAAAVVVIVGVV